MIGDVIEIGRHLSEAKVEIKELGRSWRDWLEAEFEWSDQQARRFMHIFERKSGLNKLLNADLPISALYLLAAPSTPETARTEIAERAQRGEVIPLLEVKRAVDAAKARRSPVRRSYSPATHREAKLGEDVVATLEGTCLGSAAELDALVALNRGAAEGELTAIVRGLVYAAVAGNDVSAVEIVKNGASPAANSAEEIARKDAELDELRARDRGSAPGWSDRGGTMTNDILADLIERDLLAQLICAAEALRDTFDLLNDGDPDSCAVVTMNNINVARTALDAAASYVANLREQKARALDAEATHDVR